MYRSSNLVVWQWCRSRTKIIFPLNYLFSDDVQWAIFLSEIKHRVDSRGFYSDEEKPLDLSVKRQKTKVIIFAQFELQSSCAQKALRNKVKKV